MQVRCWIIYISALFENVGYIVIGPVRPSVGFPRNEFDHDVHIWHNDCLWGVDQNTVMNSNSKVKVR